MPLIPQHRDHLRLAGVARPTRKYAEAGKFGVAGLEVQFVPTELPLSFAEMTDAKVTVGDECRRRASEILHSKVAVVRLQHVVEDVRMVRRAPLRRAHVAMSVDATN